MNNHFYVCKGGVGGSIGPTVPHAQIILTITIYIIHNVWKGVGGSKTTRENKIL